MPGDLLPVNELFETLQGEATFTGTPATFVRLQGCPVGCSWCDTKHTWPLARPGSVEKPLSVVLAKPRDSETFASLSPMDLAHVICEHRCAHVVITGGEPCIHDLEELTNRLLLAGRSVQIETSGTSPIRVAAESWVTLSPKVDMPGGLPVLADSINRANEIKFPVGRERDIDVLRERILPMVRPGVPIWLQPLSQSARATALCIETATVNGWRVSVQVHKFLGIR